MQYTDNMKISRTNQFVETEIDGEIALMNHETGKFYALAGTAMRTWQLAQNGMRLSEVVSALSNEYRVKPAQCLSDLQPMLGDLEKGGIIAVE